MKLILSILLVATSFSAFAETCKDRQILAAKQQFSIENKIYITNVNFVNFEYGPWTEMVGNNTGYDTVTVTAANKSQASYQVNAKQIGTTADCVITRIQLAH